MKEPAIRCFVAISHIPEFVLPGALLALDVPGFRFRDQIARNVLRKKGMGVLLPMVCIANACRARANIRDAHGFKLIPTGLCNLMIGSVGRESKLPEKAYLIASISSG